MACYYTQQQQRQSTPTTFSIFDFSPPPNSSILHHDVVINDDFVSAAHHPQQQQQQHHFIRSQPQYISLPTVHQPSGMPTAVYYPLSPVMSPRHVLSHHPSMHHGQHLMPNNNSHCFVSAPQHHIQAPLPQPQPMSSMPYANGYCDVTPCCRPRGPPFFNLEYRIHELNKRLLQRSDVSEASFCIFITLKYLQKMFYHHE